jgi:hypothetical protein
MSHELTTTDALEGEYIAAEENEPQQDDESSRAQREHNFKVALAAEALARGTQNTSQHYFNMVGVGQTGMGAAASGVGRGIFGGLF